MRRISLTSARVFALGELGNDVFIALFSRTGLFDQYTAKAADNSFRRTLGLVGSVAYIDAFDGSPFPHML